MRGAKARARSQLYTSRRDSEKKRTAYIMPVGTYLTTSVRLLGLLKHQLEIGSYRTIVVSDLNSSLGFEDAKQICYSNRVGNGKMQTK